MENEGYERRKFFGGRSYDCTLELVLDVIGGKWKMMMLYRLGDGEPLRSSELQRRMAGISNKMFTQTARELERDGLLSRTVYPVVPPRVEYRLTEVGRSAIPLIRALGDWGERLCE